MRFKTVFWQKKKNAIVVINYNNSVWHTLLVQRTYSVQDVKQKKYIPLCVKVSSKSSDPSLTDDSININKLHGTYNFHLIVVEVCGHEYKWFLKRCITCVKLSRHSCEKPNGGIPWQKLTRYLILQPSYCNLKWTTFILG